MSRNNDNDMITLDLNLLIPTIASPVIRSKMKSRIASTVIATHSVDAIL